MNMRSFVAVAALPLGVLASSPASAGEFTIFVYETQADLDLRDSKTPESAAYWAAYADFAAALQQSGAIRGGAPLKDPSTARTIRAGSKAMPGGYQQTGLHLGGYFQIEVATLGAAMKLAGQAPSLTRGGAV